MAKRPRSLEAFGDTVDGLYFVNHLGRIVRWNAGAERLLGYAASEVLHRKCHEVIGGRLLDGSAMCRPDCAVRCGVARGELPKSIEGYARAKDGRQVRLRFNMVVIPYRPRPLVAHVLHGSDDRVQTAGDGDAQPERRGAGLTPREREVLGLVAGGLSNSRIGVKLGISTFTARNHVQHILSKSGAHNRAEAVALAFLRRPL